VPATPPQRHPERWLVAGGILATLAGIVGWLFVGMSENFCYSYYGTDSANDYSYCDIRVAATYWTALAVCAVLALPFALWAATRQGPHRNGRQRFLALVRFVPLGFLFAWGLFPLAAGLSGAGGAPVAGTPRLARRQVVAAGLLAAGGVATWIVLAVTTTSDYSDASDDYYYFSNQRPQIYWELAAILAILSLPLIIWAVRQAARAGGQRLAVGMALLSVPLAFALFGALIPLLVGLVGIPNTRPGAQGASVPTAVATHASPTP
jgi:hypothetical protein